MKLSCAVKLLRTIAFAQSTSEPVDTAYNYDHVTSEYGPGAGSSYLFLRYSAFYAAFSRAKAAIFGRPVHSTNMNHARGGSGGGGRAPTGHGAHTGSDSMSGPVIEMKRLHGSI